MPPPYVKMPTKQQWKEDLRLATVVGNRKSPFPAFSFRGGAAHRWSFVKGKKNQLELYDTLAAGDANFSEFGACLYVIDANGAVYVCGKEEEARKLKHSSLLAGAGVPCAGTIKIKNGQVIWLTGRSGHYRPKVDQLVGVLERLRQYQVDLTDVLVFRENYTKAFQNGTGYPGKHYESCKATTLMRLRAWPEDDKHPKDLRVG